jgi:hypothetical protein
VAGAGPSLEECTPALRRHRSRFVLVAASGAVPPLRSARIDPDWVIALEARDAVLNDLASLQPETPIIVFESTHPQAILSAHGPVFCGRGLESRGGTTLVPALDFALRCSANDVFLIGADLGYGSRAYAAGAKREPKRGDLPAGVPPKFLAMRAALENLLERKPRDARVVYHVLSVAPVLRTARRMQPAALHAALASCETAKETI